MRSRAWGTAGRSLVVAALLDGAFRRALSALDARGEHLRQQRGDRHIDVRVARRDHHVVQSFDHGRIRTGVPPSSYARAVSSKKPHERATHESPVLVLTMSSTVCAATP